MRLIATIIAVLLVASTLTIGLVNFAIGCGEPEYHADGTFVTGECFVIPYTPVKGTWK